LTSTPREVPSNFSVCTVIVTHSPLSQSATNFKLKCFAIVLDVTIQPSQTRKCTRQSERYARLGKALRPIIVKKTVNACITAWLVMGVPLTLTDSDRILRTTSKASSSHRRKHRTVPRALQVTLCDPTWHVSSRSGVATLRTAIHLLLTYLLTYRSLAQQWSDRVGTGRVGSRGESFTRFHL